MEIINVVQKILLVEEEPVDLTAYKEGIATYDSDKKELTITVNESPPKDCYRLVYSTKYNFCHLIESDGITSAIWDMFCGTEEECLKKYNQLGITDINKTILKNEIEGV